MLKKALRWIVITLSVLTLLMLIGGISLYFYVQTNQHRAAQEAAEQLGFELSYEKASLTVWSTWPRVTLTIDSVMVRDLKRPLDQKPLLEADRIDAAFGFDRIWEDTLRFESLQLSGGGFNVQTDSAGTFNLGALAGARDTLEKRGKSSSPGLLNPVIDWEGVRIGVNDFRASLIDSLKNKRFVTCFDSLRTTAGTLENGNLRFLIDLATQVDGLAFNTEKGSFLSNHHLSGHVSVTRADTAWVIDTTLLRAGPDHYELAATIGRGDYAGVRLHVANPEADYEFSRALLPNSLAVKMGKYHVAGPIPVVVKVISLPKHGKNPEVTIQFSSDKQAVRMNQFQFEGVTLAGTFVNRLPEDEGGTGSRKDFRIETGPATGYYDGMFIETPGSIIRGKDNVPFLDSPVRTTGGSNALSRLFGNTNFFFTDGTFEMNTHINASLLSIEGIISTSDGTLLMKDLDVDYQAAGVRFTFGSILVEKQGADVQFFLESGDFPTGIEFTMEGYLDNILPLLLDRPADSIRTEVKLMADRLNWEGFRTLFGQEAYGEEGTESGGDSDVQVQSMKRTLLGFQQSFNPHLEVEIGKMGYYDVMELSDFSTGMRFDGDTMVLEHTTFGWAGSDLAINAKLDMGTFSKTPFSVAVDADHLNLNRLREPLTAFGLKLPKGIDSLPTDLVIRFDHRGIINDTFGIQSRHNVGELVFSDGRKNRFNGHIRYAPEDGILNTNLLLKGDPAFVNQLFAAEDFFFGSGRFRIDLELDGVPEDVEELIETAVLKLRIDSTNLRYEPAGAFLPIRYFAVNASNNHAVVNLKLTSDATRRSVELNGEMEGLSAFLFPERGETFKVKADATAGRLHASDIRTFITFDAPAPPTDTLPATTSLPSGPTNSAPPFDPQQIFSAGEGIFKSFRPDLSLRIDTFDVDRTTQFRNLHTGIRMQDSTLLILEKTGLEMDAGRVALSGNYNIDRRLKSPFTLQWRTDSVLLDKVMLTAKALGLPGTDSLGNISGILATRGDLDGRLDEGKQRLLLNRSEAGVRLKTSKIVLTDWPALTAMGKKALMKKRFAAVYLAPLDVVLRIDSGMVHIPRTELQSSALQLFVEGTVDTVNGPNMLIALPLKNIGRGLLDEAPEKTGFAHAGRKVYLVMEPGKDGETKMRFRLGRRKYYKDRWRLKELRRLKREEKAARR